jgi:secondary thiamine-phosphate synthase enzyme
MHVVQRRLTLAQRPRGAHLVTADIVAALPELRDVRAGLCHLFLQHTSASLTINENADPDVRADLVDALDRVAPRTAPYRHTAEGSDDMPAHVLSTLVGAGVLVPIENGALALGTWQGLYLVEHRDHGGARRIVATILGVPAKA